VTDWESFGKLVENASPLGLFAMFLYALVTKRLRLEREVTDRDERIVELKAEKDSAVNRLVGERDQFRDLLFTALQIGEKAATVAERSQP
jgi:hypothetical protein